MLHATVEPATVSLRRGPAPPDPSAIMADMLAGARRALDSDPVTARQWLDRLSALIGGDRRGGDEPALLLPARPPAASAVAKGGLAAWQLRRVIDLIDERLDQSIVVETLARAARLSAGHFCRAFKTSVGETPHAFLIRQRMRRAQTLMLHTDDTLSQIACACGLTDQAHLSRLFRRMVGDTPLAWRRTWRSAR